MEGNRIAKVIAASGLCSRRDAERWIAEGRVKVDGAVVTSPALNITTQKVEVDGKPIATPAPARLFRYYKPLGLVTTHKDEQGRPTVFDSLPKDMPRVVSVGRLDLNSEGLLLLTTSGELARAFELPSAGYKRVYRVRVYGGFELKKLQEALRAGITVDGVRYEPIDLEAEKLAVNSWLRMTLQEGKNREIRKVLAHFGLEVNRLIRVQYGEHALGNMKPGDIRECKLPKTRKT